MNQENFYPRRAKEVPKPSQKQLIQPTESRILPRANKPKLDPSQESSSQSTETHSPTQFCDRQKVKDYFCSWLYFIGGFIVFLLIWIIAHFSIQRLTDYYYFNDYNVSPYTSIELWSMSGIVTNTTETYFQSNRIYASEELKKADAVALSLLFSWLMWKLPLTVFTLEAIKQKNRSMQRYSSYGFFVILLLLIDVMATIFRPEGYHDWIFFVIYVALSLILVVVNGLKAKRKLVQKIRNFLLPILYIVLAYVSFSLLVPGIYGAIYKRLGEDAAYIIVYIFPVIDMIFYSLIILASYLSEPHLVKFIKMFHFLNTGYAVGHVVLFSPEDVEFYFLVGYFVVRNLSFNWIHQRIQKYVIVPCSQPGWIMAYLVSLCINFIPFVGFGKLVVSRSFYSQMLQLTLPIQSYMLPRDYYAYETSSMPQFSTYNPALKSNIQISSVFILWVMMSVTQKYHVSRMEFKEIFFYIFGIYLFYFGLATGLQLQYLQANSI